jgi:hypothetical protein
VPPGGITLVRQRPGKGYRHLVRSEHLWRFVDLVPAWTELSEGLRCVALVRGDPVALGWYYGGTIELCAWVREMVWRGVYLEPHDLRLLDKLGVPCREATKGHDVEFDEHTARAYQLVRVFMHELGHHHDRMATRSQQEPSRGELFAERYSIEREDLLLARYFRAFGW